MLTEADIRVLGERTDGYRWIDLNSLSPPAGQFCNFSGADISIVVRDALMQPVRKVWDHLNNLIQIWNNSWMNQPKLPRFKLRHISWQCLGRTGTTLIQLSMTYSPLAGRKLSSHSIFYIDPFQPWDKGSQGDDLDGCARRKASWTKGRIFWPVSSCDASQVDMADMLRSLATQKPTGYLIFY